MHEIYLVKVPKTLDLITHTPPITIMTRSPVVWYKSAMPSPYCFIPSKLAIACLKWISKGYLGSIIIAI